MATVCDGFIRPVLVDETIGVKNAEHKSRNFLHGPDRCGWYTNEAGILSVRLRTTVCYVWLSIVVILSLLRICAILLMLFSPNEIRQLYNSNIRYFSCITLFTLMISIAAPYMMYKHCQRCNGWMGTMKVIGFTVALFALDIILGYYTLETVKGI